VNVRILDPLSVVLDTNVFVGAGFNPSSSSARLLAAVREGRLRLVWNDATRDETAHILRQIPKLSWEAVAPLFRPSDRFAGAIYPEAFDCVPDPADRTFAALAHAANVVLVTSDRGLLQASECAGISVLRPGAVERQP
jgi:predicted nucleic acid-binding protein